MSVQAPDQVVVCPKCHTAEPWGQNSWCPSCGFYPKFASEAELAAAAEAQAEPPQSPAEIEEPENPGSLPEWMQVTIAGIFLILIASAGYRAWAYFNGGSRALVAISQMGIGFAMVLGASIRAWWQCRKSDRRMGLADVVTNPFYIWQPTLEQMPETRRRVWIAIWGVTMIFAANVVVGGFKYSGLYTSDWGFEQPESDRNLLAEALQHLKKGGGDDVDAEELIEDLKQYQAQLAAGLPAEPPTTEVCVYGFLRDGDYEIGRLLVARRSKGLLKHCAVLKGQDIYQSDGGENYTVLTRVVAENLTEEPAVSSMLNATWVRPSVQINVTFEDIVGDGELVGPKFHSIVKTEDAEEEEDEKQMEKEKEQDETEEQKADTDEDEDGDTDDIDIDKDDTDNQRRAAK